MEQPEGGRYRQEAQEAVQLPVATFWPGGQERQALEKVRGEEAQCCQRHHQAQGQVPGEGKEEQRGPGQGECGPQGAATDAREPVAAEAPGDAGWAA